MSTHSHAKVIDKQEMQRLISKNLLISVFSKVFHLITRLFIPPLALSFVTLEEYGIWAICFILIGYLSLGAFGVSNVYIRYVAEYHANNETEKINSLVSTGIILVVLITLVLLAAFWFMLPLLIEEIFRISPELHSTAFVFFFGTACVFMFDLSIGTFKYILNGLQKIAEAAWVWIGCLTLETILIVVFFFSGFGIYSLFYAFIIRYLVSFVIYGVMSYKLIPGLSIGLQHFDVQYLKLFYRFGGIVQIGGMLGVFLRSIDKVIASTTLDMKATALLDVGNRFPLMAITVPSAMNAVFLPAIAYMHNQNRKQEMIDVYLQGSRSMSLLTGFIMGFLTAFAPLLVVAWLGTNPEFRDAAIIMALFSLPQQLHVLTGPGTAFFNGINEPMKALYNPLLRTILTGLGATILFSFYEVNIVTISIMVAVTTIIAALLYSVYTNYVIELKQSTFITKVLLPGLMPYLVSYGIYWSLTPWLEIALLNRWYAAALVLISGVLYCLIIPMIVYWGIYETDERQQVKDKMTKILRRNTLDKPSL